MLKASDYECAYIDHFGDRFEKGAGNLSYVRSCYDPDICADKPETGQEWFPSLTFPCTVGETLAKICSNMPEPGYMFNPCMSGEVMVEVTNDGEHYSGGYDLNSVVGGTSIISTVRYANEKPVYNSYKNYTIPSTFSVYTYVYPEYWYLNTEIADMEKAYCTLPRYSEEHVRDREKGWFKINSNEAAHVQVNLAHLPDDFVYDQHYKLALYMLPSRCTEELCNAARVRVSPEEFLPCRRPKDLSYWFQQTNVPKNVLNNLTIYALDDLIFKIEIQILNGLYAAYEPLFKNTTTVRIASPSRTTVFTGLGLGQYQIERFGLFIPGTRRLSKYISYEESVVPMQLFYCAVVYLADTYSISQPLNMPPLYKAYERGRVLIMNNVSSDNSRVPVILDSYSDINSGTSFWNMPSTTSDESKELLDAYFETFHDTTYDAINGYVFAFDTLLIPYLPYFSNCNTFDSYIPIWMLLEGQECELPVDFDPLWPRYKFKSLPDQDDIKFVGPFDFFANPIADWCERTIQCNYEEQLKGQDNTPRWYETSSGTSLFSIIRYPIDYNQYTGRSSSYISQDDLGGGNAVYDSQADSGDNFISVFVDHAVGDLIGGCVYQCMARSYLLTIKYYQVDNYQKRIVSIDLVGDNYDFDTDDTTYELSTSYYALGFVDLIISFAFPISIFCVIFVLLGVMSNTMAMIGWFMCRITTNLQNPPPIKVFAMLVLTVPPAAAGVYMAIAVIFFLTCAGNFMIYGYFFTNPDNPEYITPLIAGSDNAQDRFWTTTFSLDLQPLAYADIGGTIAVDEMLVARSGRVGAMFFIIGILCFISSSKFFFPKKESKREREIAKKRTNYAEKEDLWDPVMWKKSNFMFTSFCFSLLLVAIVEFSFWGSFGDEIYTIIVGLIVAGEFLKIVVEHQLQDKILCAPLMCSWEFISQLVTFGSPDFFAFLTAYFLGVAVGMFSRVYQSFYVDNIFDFVGSINSFIYRGLISLIPKYLLGGPAKVDKAAAEDNKDEADFRKREVEGVAESGEESESVEPILDYFSDVCSDTMILFYFPFFVLLLMQYRNEIQIPIIYGIRQSDMVIYLVFQVFMCLAEPISDVFNHSQNENFAGWKVYEYLVYSRYRFLQRESRWKGLENSLDECIDEKFRRLDQMCFSSQYYLMLTCQTNGIIYIVLGFECWLRVNYSPFTDAAFFLLLAYMIAVYKVLEFVLMQFGVLFKVWKIKHENTAWHLIQKEQDELDLPGWEEVKGASTEAFIMNQRITSETFRYKFLNYNRTWLIHQLPQLLTPRTMRRSRPYLINQFARIINARRDDISDDSDKDKTTKFGPVVLTAPSRNIIRWWLGKAKRRIKLRGIVEPLIKRARGATCEQCLSRKQLQIEYEVDIDKMGDMYDNAYPGDVEVDQVQWKSFWVNNQRYHTVCLACLTKRKEVQTRNALKGGAFDPSVFDDEQEAYPDWGPVFLTAASKAILLNWYRKAQRLRAGKKGKRKDKQNKAISDDEGDDVPVSWLNELSKITPATTAIAVKWMRTARARLQQKRGKGVSTRESEVEDALGSIADNTETYRSGKKSRSTKK
jgi:hypothetical protein